MKKLMFLVLISGITFANVHGSQPPCVCGTKAMQSLLYDAVCKNAYYRVLALLDAGADPRMADNTGITSLHYAAMNDDIAIMSLLVGRGANVNAANKEGLTPALVACIQANRAPFVFLIQNCDANCSMSDIEDWMKKVLASPMPDKARRSLILAYDQLKNRARSLLERQSLKRAVLQSAWGIHKKMSRNCLSLKIGIRIMLKQFIERNRSFLIKPLSLNEQTQMLRIIESWLTKIHGRTVEALMRELCNVVWTQTLKNLYAPEYHARLLTDLFEKLIEVFSKQYKDAQVININRLDAEKGHKSLLHQAVEIGDVDFVVQLCDLGADVEVKDTYGDTPLAYAVRTGNDTMFQMLIEMFGADMNMVSYDGKTIADLLKETMDEAEEMTGESGRLVQTRLDNIQAFLAVAQKSKHKKLQRTKQDEDRLIAVQAYEELIADRIVEDLYSFVVIHQYCNVPIDCNILVSRLKEKGPLVEQVFKSNRRASALTLTELLMHIVWYENLADMYELSKHKIYSTLLWGMLYKRAQEFVALLNHGAYAQAESKQEKRSGCGAAIVRSAYE